MQEDAEGEAGLQQNEALAGARQRKAGIFAIDRFAGVDLVFLYALDSMGRPIERAEALTAGRRCQLEFFDLAVR